LKRTDGVPEGVGRFPKNSRGKKFRGNNALVFSEEEKGEKGGGNRTTTCGVGNWKSFWEGNG